MYTSSSKNILQSVDVAFDYLVGFMLELHVLVKMTFICKSYLL